MTGRDVIVRRDVEVPMSDGVLLRADLWLPASGGPVPVLLQRLPYDKSSSFMAQHIIGLEILRAVDAGFAVVVQDTRGRFASDGDFEPFRHETADGRDTVAWVRDQDFCDGNVFMYGASYIGATQLLASWASCCSG
jgi:putative CocE/NonD family hydrolase